MKAARRLGNLALQSNHHSNHDLLIFVLKISKKKLFIFNLFHCGNNSCIKYIKLSVLELKLVKLSRYELSSVPPTSESYWKTSTLV
jgi:hypothetical protein